MPPVARDGVAWMKCADAVTAGPRFAVFEPSMALLAHKADLKGQRNGGC
jgi:hypothetical protein